MDKVIGTIKGYPVWDVKKWFSKFVFWVYYIFWGTNISQRAPTDVEKKMTDCFKNITEMFFQLFYFTRF